MLARARKHNHSIRSNEVDRFHRRARLTDGAADFNDYTMDGVLGMDITNVLIDVPKAEGIECVRV